MSSSSTTLSSVRRVSHDFVMGYKDVVVFDDFILSIGAKKY